MLNLGISLLQNPADSPFVKAGNGNVSAYTSKVNFVSNAAYSLQVVAFFFPLDGSQ